MLLQLELRPRVHNVLATNGTSSRNGPSRIGETWDLDLLPVGDNPRADYATAAEPAHLVGSAAGTSSPTSFLMRTSISSRMRRTASRSWPAGSSSSHSSYCVPG